MASRSRGQVFFALAVPGACSVTSSHVSQLRRDVGHPWSFSVLRKLLHSTEGGLYRVGAAGGFPQAKYVTDNLY